MHWSKFHEFDEILENYVFISVSDTFSYRSEFHEFIDPAEICVFCFRYYLKNFENYPPNRKAVIPFILWRIVIRPNNDFMLRKKLFSYCYLHGDHNSFSSWSSKSILMTSGMYFIPSKIKIKKNDTSLVVKFERYFAMIEMFDYIISR